jgi:hypothetical protein
MSAIISYGSMASWHQLISLSLWPWPCQLASGSICILVAEKLAAGSLWRQYGGGEAV